MSVGVCIRQLLSFKASGLPDYCAKEEKIPADGFTFVEHGFAEKILSRVCACAFLYPRKRIYLFFFSFKYYCCAFVEQMLNIC